MINKLQTRRDDIESCLALHNERGFRRLLVGQRIIIRDIQEQRRKLSPSYLRRRQAIRKLFVDLTAKDMLFRAVPWFDTELTTAERAELAAITCEVPDVDLESWKSLAKLERRRTNVHLYVISMSQTSHYSSLYEPRSIGCDGCQTAPIIGIRFTCLKCYGVSSLCVVHQGSKNNAPSHVLDFDLCSECERKVHSPEPGTIPMEIGDHMSSHPIIKVTRLVWDVEDRTRDGFRRTYNRLYLDEDDGSDEDEDDTSGRNNPSVNTDPELTWSVHRVCR